MVEEIAQETGIDVNDFVKLFRSDLKDKKKKDKFLQFVLYAVQEALKTDNKTTVTAETFKSEKLRRLVIQLIEASLRFAGYIASIAVIGNKFSYEAKSSRHTMSLYTIGKAAWPVFHIMIYDLAYINVPNINVMSHPEFDASVKSLKKGL